MNSLNQWFRRSASTRPKSKRKRPNDIEDEENTTSFSRGSVQYRSIDNYRLVQQYSEALVTENRHVRQNNEFLGKRTKFLEAELKVVNELRQQDEEREAALAEVENITQERNQYKEKTIQLEEEKTVFLEKLCVMEKRNNVLQEQLLQTTRSKTKLESMVETALKKLTLREKTDADTEKRLAEVKHILLSTKQEFLQRLMKVDETTRAIYGQIDSVLKLPAAMEKFKDTKYSRLPKDVKLILRDLQDVVGPNWPQFAMELGLDPRFVMELHDMNKKDLRYFYWRTVCAWYTLGTASLVTLETAGRRIGVNIFKVSPMPERHRHVLDRKYADIIYQIVNAVLVLNEMRTSASVLSPDQCITPAAVAYVTETKTPTEQKMRLLDLLVTLGEHAFEIFVDALKASGHEHLAEELIAEEKQLQEMEPSASHDIPVVSADTASTAESSTHVIVHQSEHSQLSEQDTIVKTKLPEPEVVLNHEQMCETMIEMKTGMKHIESMLMAYETEKGNNNQVFV